MNRWPACLLASLSLCISVGAWSAPRESQEFATVLKLRADTGHGREIFAKCASCHGADGAGDVSGSVPRIAGQHYRVLARQLVDFRNGKRWDMRMEGVATSHDVIPELQDVADVAQYVSELSPEGKPGVGDGENLEQGARLYATRCASCHGVSGDGDAARGLPRIAGQHAAYVSRQIYDAVDGRRPALTRSHRKLFAPLDFQEVRGLADWLSRQGSRPPAN